MDSGSGSGSDSLCGWWAQPSNFDPCNIPGATGPLTVSMIDTDQATCTYDSNGRDVCLVHVTSIAIGNGGLEIVHSMAGRPIILVSDGAVTITGGVTVDPATAASMSCNAAIGADSLQAGGGAGGGFATLGGNGGASSTAVVATGGAMFGTMSDVPLELGCPGAAGGTPDSSARAFGGLGGGALEISSNTSIEIDGIVTANGGGGGPGNHTVATMTLSGGGGGGTGGSLLLESPAITLGSGAQVCAVGGGGGQGSTRLATGLPGDDGNQCAPGAGGASGDTHSDGGAGGGSNPPIAGQSEGTVGTTTGGGGGGGGAAGRIHFHASGSPTLMSGAQVVPGMM